MYKRAIKKNNGGGSGGEEGEGRIIIQK